MTSLDTVHGQAAAPRNRVARGLMLLILSVTFGHSPAGAATGGRITGTVFINTKPAAGAVVFLHPPPGQPSPPAAGETPVRQETLRFSPDFLVVPAGSTIRFENHDDEIHNIHSRTPGNRFDTGAHLPGTVKDVILQRPGAVPIRCRTHRRMRALILVTPSPYFSVTDEFGRFEISKAPAGRYRVEAWHPQLTTKERLRGMIDLELDAGEQVVHLRLAANAETGTDLTEIMDRDWAPVVEQIRTELDRAISHWKNGRITAATSKIMSVQSRVYGESGLRDAITEIFGKTRQAEHEQRLDAMRKRIQGIGTDATAETTLHDQAKALIAELTADVNKIAAP